MKLRFTPRATENVTAIADYVRERNPSAARKVRASIYEGLQYIVMYPQIGRQQKERGVRKFVTPRYAYLIYYMIEEVEEEIIVLSVKHSAQQREFGDA